MLMDGITISRRRSRRPNGEETMTTIETITNDQILDLREEAARAGDYEQVEICDLAIGGEHDARAECARVIARAEVAAND